MINPAVVALRIQQTIFETETFTERDMGLQDRHRMFAILRVNETRPVAFDFRLHRSTRPVFPGFVDPRELARSIRYPEQHRRRVGHLAQAMFGGDDFLRAHADFLFE